MSDVPICGWCPPGGLAEDYPEPPGLLAEYPELVEGASSGYVERTAWNVRDSHATLIVAPDGIPPRGGTEMTRIFAERFGRPVMRAEPFVCYRPTPERARGFASLPYDVFDRTSAASYVADHPTSFLAIDRPETSFPPDHDMFRSIEDEPDR